jgi:hypothetical protein
VNALDAAVAADTGRVAFMTYADERFEDARALFLRTHERLFDNAFNYGPKSIKNERYATFLQKVSDTAAPVYNEATERSYYDWKVTRNGCFFWRPVLVLQALTELKDGDYLVYADTRTRAHKRAIKTDLKRVLAHRRFRSRLPLLLQQTNWAQEYVALPATFEVYARHEQSVDQWRKAPQWSMHGIAMRNTPRVRALFQKTIDLMMLDDGRALLDDSLPHPGAGISTAIGDGGANAGGDGAAASGYQGSRPGQAAFTFALLFLGETPVEFRYTTFLKHWPSVVNERTRVVDRTPMDPHDFR